MRVGGALCIGLAACTFHPGGTPGDGGGDVPIIPIDVPNIDVPSNVCMGWTPHFFDPCMIPAPLGDLHLTTAGGPYTYDTSSNGGVLLDNSSAQVGVANTTVIESAEVTAALISVGMFEIDATVELHVIGSKPLIVAAWGPIRIAGTVDAGSYTTAATNPVQTGAGSNPTTCAAAQAGHDETTPGGGSGGGGGGGFQGVGGMGGPGDTGGENPGGAGGLVIPTPMIVHGGCSGAASGKAGPSAGAPSDANTIAPGGAGGGAIQLTSKDSITIIATGRVLAGGGGGGGAPSNSAVGGGGGGAGGYAGFEAPTITTTGAMVIAANGGAGGASAGFAGVGDVGDDGQPSATAAAGGAAVTCAFAGGNGAAGGTLTGASASQTMNSCGGGGGGGGAGYIYVFAPAFTPGGGAVISPARTLNPS
jgi:hypothetical protein